MLPALRSLFVGADITELDDIPSKPYYVGFRRLRPDIFFSMFVVNVEGGIVVLRLRH